MQAINLLQGILIVQQASYLSQKFHYNQTITTLYIAQTTEISQRICAYIGKGVVIII